MSQTLKRLIMALGVLGIVALITEVVTLDVKIDWTNIGGSTGDTAPQDDHDVQQS
ncbi:MAG TPA: hypothetical protein VK694_03360 [Verrucomicrobiae bacterium]|nr:hypothetical protein [Verrucomicrobiae bacterium]